MAFSSIPTLTSSLLGMNENLRHLAAQVAIAQAMVNRLGAAAAPLAQLAHYLTNRGH
ncbi:MAG: hypothetical protein ACP5O7_03695 [Phycisphaerae bacterium]